MASSFLPKTWCSSQPLLAQADASAGTYDLAVQGFGGGGSEAAAGLGTWFFSTRANQSQRFAALLDYADLWWASAFAGYFAKSALMTQLWVWGVTENQWVARSLGSPFWKDSIASSGGGWAEIGDFPTGEGGRISNETFFSAAPNSWYLCWVWSDADIYTSGAQGSSSSAASTQVSVSVPFVVFGNL